MNEIIGECVKKNVNRKSRDILSVASCNNMKLIGINVSSWRYALGKIKQNVTFHTNMIIFWRILRKGGVKNSEK